MQNQHTTSCCWAMEPNRHSTGWRLFDFCHTIWHTCAQWVFIAKMWCCETRKGHLIIRLFCSFVNYLLKQGQIRELQITDLEVNPDQVFFPVLDIKYHTTGPIGWFSVCNHQSVNIKVIGMVQRGQNSDGFPWKSPAKCPPVGVSEVQWPSHDSHARQKKSHLALTILAR